MKNANRREFIYRQRRWIGQLLGTILALIAGLLAGCGQSGSLRAEELPWRSRTDFLSVVRTYADAMIEHGRDTYGEQQSGLLLSALDRHTLRPLATRPAPPGGIRREDRTGLPWRTDRVESAVGRESVAGVLRAERSDRRTALP